MQLINRREKSPFTFPDKSKIEAVGVYNKGTERNKTEMQMFSLPSSSIQDPAFESSKNELAKEDFHFNDASFPSISGKNLIFFVSVTQFFFHFSPFLLET